MKGIIMDNTPTIDPSTIRAMSDNEIQKTERELAHAILKTFIGFFALKWGLIVAINLIGHKFSKNS